MAPYLEKYKLPLNKYYPENKNVAQNTLPPFCLSAQAGTQDGFVQIQDFPLRANDVFAIQL